MAFEDLQQAGILLPKKLWGRLSLSASVDRRAVSLVLALGAVSCVLMALGGGGPLTWVGALLFPMFLVLFTIVSDRGIERQNAICTKLLSKGRPNKRK